MTFKVGEIIGHRYWIWSWGHHLFGPYSGHSWNPDCASEGNGKVERRDSHAGIYALKTRIQVDTWLELPGQLDQLYKTWTTVPLLPPHGTSDFHGIVIGTVRLWGTVWECTDGYRAQFGRVHSLDEAILLPSNKRIEASLGFNKLREKYGV